MFGPRPTVGAMEAEGQATPELIFEEPPRVQRRQRQGRSPLGLWLAELRNYPGEWARYPQRCGSAASVNIRDGSRYDVKAGEFETTTRNRNQQDGSCDLYARYIGTES